MLAHKWACGAAIPYLLITLILSALAPAHGSEVITGEPRIVDGDTVEIGQTKIRLAGIDAPETDQLCLDAAGLKWACGVAARTLLTNFSANRKWKCDLAETDKYGRALGTCFVDGENANQWMVRHGWALSFIRYSHQYDKEEEVARGDRAGLWSGAFVAPWDWRHRSAKTVIHGAVSVPIKAQKLLLSAVSAENAPSPDCIIKAAVGGRECIYHLPGDLWYGKMRMNGGNKRWFCSLADAEAAGCRPPQHLH